MKAQFALAAILFLALEPVVAQQPEEKLLPCKGNPEQVSECFRIRGRLRIYNGTPSLRIWRVGTKRILGVSEAHAGIRRMPESLEEKVGFGIDIFGDFEVCPFTPETPGEMQFVCIESASNLVIKDWNKEQKK